METDLENLVKRALASIDLKLWGLEFFCKTNDYFLRIFICKQNSLEPINIEHCELATKQINLLLGTSNMLESYTLEVSSPGIKRKIFHKEQYRDYIGHKIILRLSSPIDDNYKIYAIIKDSDELGLTISYQHDYDKVFFIEYNNIKKATINLLED